MIWPLDGSLPKSRCLMKLPMLGAKAGSRGSALRAAGLCLAIAASVAMPIASPVVADDVRTGEKLIGTFEIRSGQAQDRAETRNVVRRAADVPAGDPSRQITPAQRRNFLTGESSVPQTPEDILRREVGDRVFFGSGSAEIGTRARTVIATQAEWLRQNPLLRVTIEGHADDGGTAEQNTRFALERAEALRERLIEEGVDARRIAVVSRGREDRLAVCNEPSCMAQNRRAIVVVHAVGSGERIGLDRTRVPGIVPPRAGEADGSRRMPVPR